MRTTIAEEVHCTNMLGADNNAHVCGHRLQVVELASTVYEFCVEKGGGGAFISFGKSQMIDPIDDLEFFCTNPECNVSYSREEVLKMAQEQKENEE